MICNNSRSIEVCLDCRVKQIHWIMKKYRYMILLIIFSLLSCSKTSILFDEAVGLDNQKKYLEAIIVWDKLIEYDPAHLSAYISRSADKFALGQYLEAIKDYWFIRNLQ